MLQVSSSGIQAPVCSGCGAPTAGTPGHRHWSPVLRSSDSCVPGYSTLHWTAGPTASSVYTSRTQQIRGGTEISGWIVDGQ